MTAPTAASLIATLGQPLAQPAAPPPAPTTVEVARFSLDSWVTAHRSSFISHTIVTHNVAAVLSEGVLRATEELFRIKGSVTVSAKGGIKVDLFSDAIVEAALGDYRVRLQEYWKQVTDFQYVNGSFRQSKCAMNSKKVMRVIIELAFDEYFKEKKSSKNFTRFFHSVWIYLDKKEPHLVKVAKAFRDYLGKDGHMSSSFPVTIRMHLSEVGLWENRYHTIRFVENGVSWAHGSVVVLRGNPQNALCVRAVADPTVGSEVELPNPVRNAGRYATLNLKDKDTLILGTRKELKAFRVLYPNLYYFEELSDEQRLLFGLPVRKK
jgi:hypothetical protein